MRAYAGLPLPLGTRRYKSDNMKTEDNFLGQGWAFPPDFSMLVSGPRMVSGAEDIEQSLRILFSTQLGERILRPTYGCNLEESVFEDFDRTSFQYLKDTLETAIIYHEPRIRLHEITIGEGPNRDGTIQFDLSYTIRSTNTRTNMVYPFNVYEATKKFYP